DQPHPAAAHSRSPFPAAPQASHRSSACPAELAAPNDSPSPLRPSSPMETNTLSPNRSHEYAAARKYECVACASILQSENPSGTPVEQIQAIPKSDLPANPVRTSSRTICIHTQHDRILP